jgi:hypothetical protein
VAEDSAIGTGGAAEASEVGAAPDLATRPEALARHDPYRPSPPEPRVEAAREPLRDIAREGLGEEPPSPEATPAAHFAPVTPAPPPPGPAPVVVRQPSYLVLIVVIALLGLAGAGLLAWQLRLLQGEMAHLAATVTEVGRIADSVGRLSDAATQANEIATQALVSTTRPWIGVDTVEAGPIVANHPLNIEVRVRNSGRTPSTDMQGLFLVYISPIDSPPAELSDPCASCARSVVLPNGMVSYKLAVHDTVMTPQEVQRIKAGQDTMWIVGRLDYHDGEGEPHTTQSCLYYRASGIPGFGACNDGNSAN